MERGARARRDPLSDRFLVDWALRRFASERPEHPALVVPAADGAAAASGAGGDRTVTYAELDRLVDRGAEVIRAAGVTRGDRVLIMLDNGLGAVVAFYAALRADAVPSILGVPKQARRLSRIAARARPALIITGDDVAGSAGDAALAALSVQKLAAADLFAGPRAGAATAPPTAAAPRRASIDLDLATICWTSGSTGEPKGVMLTHANVRASCAAIGAYLGHDERLRRGESDVILCALPLAHTYGLFQVLVTHSFGGTVVLEKGFQMAFPLLARMAALGVTGFAGVPTIFAAILGLKQLGELDLSRLRYLTNAAYALPAAHLARLAAALPHVQFFAMYGQTECTRVCYLPPADALTHAESVGIAMPNQEAWLVDEAGREVTAGATGELVIRGANVMRGYFDDPEATARALRPGPIPGEVVLHTGDLFRQDDTGYLVFVARKDDVIKTRGEKVAPIEVEQVIAKLAGVVECAVVGVPDPIHGTAVKAAVVLAPGAQVSADDVKRAVRAELDDAAIPRQVVFVTELPRAASGKVIKSELQ